ncbi:hypothetical protein BOVA604_941 [Bacteroides ovatus]|nr:hypothetical protein BOVA604_941 [Bacteroides ovatus]
MILNSLLLNVSIREIVWALAQNAKLKFDIWSNSLSENAV